MTSRWPRLNRRELIRIWIGALSVTGITHAATETTAPSLSQAIAFTLDDQHQTTRHYRFPRLKTSILIFADYAGSAQLEPWIRPLYARYRDTIDIDGVANLVAVPKFIRSFVRAAFRDRLARPVMLDWSGEVSTDYRYQSGKANLFVIAPSGRILLRVMGEVNEAKLQMVWDAIDGQGVVEE